MKNKGIKTILLFLVIGGIAAAIILTQKSIDRFAENQKIQPFDFSKYAERTTDASVYGSGEQAKARYVDVYDIITTENGVQTNNGQLLSSSEVNHCYNYAFAAYWNIKHAELKNFFYTRRRVWDSSKRKELREEFLFIRNREGHAIAMDTVRKYEEYLKQYGKALTLISNSKKQEKCTSYNDYKKMCTESNNYKKYPYLNATDLQSDLKEVPNYANESWKRYIISQINSLIDKDFSNDDNKERFTAEYNVVKGMKDSYVNNMGNSTDLAKAFAALDDQSDYWSTYFVEKQKREQYYNYNNYSY